ncbi:hypothetical protein A3194_08105 [Candidatus Thiodiazotropha endoloripes]|uniref:hypothetical protein n=1 Tax=Candidatus Thiodiazotropha endoloripes TaxID=1818881 RepID=UPI00083E09F8|nr:hypothetical protein [Candidatus Thiodiazotropha endoloripes]ODB92342.1 hypothetical protein A3194_08105 [Candidatus Thiodiazotropha endoloripes]
MLFTNNQITEDKTEDKAGPDVIQTTVDPERWVRADIDRLPAPVVEYIKELQRSILQSSGRTPSRDWVVARIIDGTLPLPDRAVTPEHSD